jgi:DNA repair protein NreA
MNIQWMKTKGRTFDPIQLKVAAQKSYNKVAKQDYAGKAPNIFVGRYGYPNVNVGILNTEHYTTHDNPPHWSEHNTQIPEIIKLRTQLVNSSFKASIKNFNNKFLELSQEIAQASKPAEVEINLKQKPQFRIQFKKETLPHGPRVKLKKAALTSNPTIKRHIDKAVSDTDLKASNAMSYLYKRGYDEHIIIKLLTVGNLGVKPQRKLVPTRWGITATHSNIGNMLVKQVKDYIHYDYAAHFGSYLGNYYLILMFPEVWNYELFETITVEEAPFSTDFEPYEGRKQYAEETAGGFYTVRMACLEQLKKIKRQASVLALRFINPNEYIAPLGVWVTLEATRKTMESKPIIFGSKELMLHYTRLFIKKKFNIDVDTILRRSKLLHTMQIQKKLRDFN